MRRRPCSPTSAQSWRRTKRSPRTIRRAATATTRCGRPDVSRAAPALADHTMRFESDADIVRQVRIGRHPNNITRIVLDAAGVASYSVYPLYNPYRLVIDCVRATIAAATPAPSALADVQREPT